MLEVNPPPYQPVREKNYDKSFFEIAGNTSHSRITDIENAIDWAVSRNPYLFPEITWEGKPYRYFKFEDLGNGFPQVIILFEIDEFKKTVLLINIKEI